MALQAGQEKEKEDTKERSEDKSARRQNKVRLA
jgi:hypothetical protein